MLYYSFLLYIRISSSILFSDQIFKNYIFMISTEI